MDLGGPNDRVNIIKAQCIKAIADYYNIEDWIAIWDPTLSRRENAVLFKHNAEPDMRRFK